MTHQLLASTSIASAVVTHHALSLCHALTRSHIGAFVAAGDVALPFHFSRAALGAPAVDYGMGSANVVGAKLGPSRPR